MAVNQDYFFLQFWIFFSSLSDILVQGRSFVIINSPVWGIQPLEREINRGGVTLFHS